MDHPFDQPRFYLKRRGYYFRPDAKGYTSSFLEAGMFGKEYAEKYCRGCEGVTMEEVV